MICSVQHNPFVNSKSKSGSIKNHLFMVFCVRTIEVHVLNEAIGAWRLSFCETIERNKVVFVPLLQFSGAKQLGQHLLFKSKDYQHLWPSSPANSSEWTAVVSQTAALMQHWRKQCRCSDKYRLRSGVLIISNHFLENSSQRQNSIYSILTLWKKLYIFSHKKQSG